MTRKIRVAAFRTPVFILTLAMVAMVLTSCGGVNQNNVIFPILPTPTPSNVVNTVPVTVGVTSSGGYTNGVFTYVTVCRPAVLPVGQNPESGPPPPATCQTIPNILVDTGSVGLRLIESSAVDSLSLPVVTDSNDNTIQECVQFADFSYVWGPVARATIEMADENATQVPLEGETANIGIPIQVITSPLDLSISVPSNCLSSPLAGGAPIAANTLRTLGANGILGVGSFLQDCGSACASSTPRPQYYSCPSGLCSVAAVPLDMQLWNPVSAFQYDNNGLSLTLPGVGFSGSSSITGSLIFGIQTQSNNTLGSAEVFAIDAYGNFPQVTFTEPSPIDPSLPPVLSFNYLSPQNGSYIDTASPAIYFSDAQTLDIPECLEDGKPLGLYCPPAFVNYSAKLYGTNNALPWLFAWDVSNAATLLKSGNSVFATLGGDSGIDMATDYVDFGVPFFLGQTVFVGFAGTTIAYPLATTPATYANGFWAF